MRGKERRVSHEGKGEGVRQRGQLDRHRGERTGGKGGWRERTWKRVSERRGDICGGGREEE